MSIILTFILGVGIAIMFCCFCYLGGLFWEQGKKEANKKSITDDK